MLTQVLLLEQQLADKTYSAESHVEELTQLRTELVKERASFTMQRQEERDRVAGELGRVKALHVEQCRELQAQVERATGEKAEKEREVARLKGALKGEPLLSLVLLLIGHSYFGRGGGGETIGLVVEVLNHGPRLPGSSSTMRQLHPQGALTPSPKLRRLLSCPTEQTLNCQSGISSLTRSSQLNQNSVLLISWLCGGKIESCDCALSHVADCVHSHANRFISAIHSMGVFLFTYIIHEAIELYQ